MTVPTLTTEFLKSPEGVAELNRILQLFSDNVAGDTETVRVYDGYGSPESAITAGIGSLYLRLDGGTGTTVYIKESGTGDTGWIPIAKLATPVSLANGGTGQDLSTNNQGDIYYDGGSNGFTRLTPGTSGQFLKTQGAAANPVWAGTPLVLAGHKDETSVTATTNITIQANKSYIVYYSGKSHASTDALIGIRFNDATVGYSNVGTGSGISDQVDLCHGTVHDANSNFWGCLQFSTVPTAISTLSGVINGVWETTANVQTMINQAFIFTTSPTSIELMADAAMQNAVITVYECAIT